MATPGIPVNERTDWRLDDTRQMILISGSNMSGKSTMLRTVGINVALALAGAPVRARKLCDSPLPIAAAINALDVMRSLGLDV